MTQQQPQQRHWFVLWGFIVLLSQAVMILSILSPAWLLPLTTLVTTMVLMGVVGSAYNQGKIDEIVKQTELIKAETVAMLAKAGQHEHLLHLTGGGPLDGQTVPAPPSVAIAIKAMAEEPEGVRLTTTLSCFDEDNMEIGWYAFADDDYHTLTWFPKEDDD